MEKNIPEFEEYLAAVKAALRTEASIKEDICSELRQSLYQKYNELLIKRYGIDTSVYSTLINFEDSNNLARMFNSVYKENIHLDAAMKVVRDKRIILVAMIAILIMAAAI